MTVSLNDTIPLNENNSGSDNNRNINDSRDSDNSRSSNNSTNYVKNNISFHSLKGFEKAAILLNYLGPSATKKLFCHLGDMKIKKLLGAMVRLKVVPVTVTQKILEEFYRIINESDVYIFSNKTTSRETVVEAVGEERACEILARLGAHSISVKSLESLEQVDTSFLTHFLLNEHPQTISVILAHLEPERKGEVLKDFPEGLRVEVALRLSQLDRVPSEFVLELDRILKQEFSLMPSMESVTLGGPQVVADMLNAVDKETEDSIMIRLEERDPHLTEDIRRRMFIFEDLIRVDDKGIQFLLREIPHNKLLLALEKASDEVRKKIFKNLSPRAAEMLKEDLDHMGSSRLSDVEEAQMEIIHIVRKFEKEKKMVVARDM